MTQQRLPTYIKHLIECKCILKLYENETPPRYHQFVVFSELEYSGETDVVGTVKSSIAQCNNCAAVHKVLEIGISELVSGGEVAARRVPTIDEVELELPEKLSRLLRQNECELHVWQEAAHIIANGLWGSFVVLSKVSRQDKDAPKEYFKSVDGKALVILGESIFKIETFDQTT